MAESVNKPVDLSKHGEEPIRKMWARVVEFVTPLTKLHEKILEASPPSVLELDKELNSSDDPQITEFREEIKRLEEAVRQMREDAHKHILGGYNSIPESDLKTLKDEFSGQYKKVQTTIAMLRNYAEMFEVSGVKEELDRFEVPTLRGTTRVSGASSSTNSPRAQVSSIEVTKPGKKMKSVKRFSDAAAYTSLETTQIVKAWMEEAGVSEWQSATVPVGFDIDDIHFVVTPRAASEDTESEDEDTDSEE